MLIVCAQCGTTNRVPDERLGEDPKCGKCRAPLLDGKPVALGEANFDAVIKGGLPVVVDFWADWCQPCHMMAPQFERAAAELKTRARFAKVNTETAQSVAARYGIRSIPTLILFRNGQEVSRLAGARDARAIVQWASMAG
jgi:thioredoxin 2